MTEPVEPQTEEAVVYARRRSDRRVYRAGLGAIVAWAVIATFGVIALGINTISDHKALDRSTVALQRSTNTNQRLTNAILHGCVRDNVVRALDNESHYTDYEFITQQITFTAATLHSNYLALRRIGLSKSVLDRALKQSEAALVTQRRQAASKSWVPLTNCQTVVDVHGGKYLPPEPIPFSKGRPLASALSQSNARLLDPRGSVGS